MRAFMARLTRFLGSILDDILIITGGACLVYGAWQVLPVAAWFVAGAELIALGVLVGIGGRR